MITNYERTKQMSEGMYLPPALRDFHDQKDVFKQMSSHYEGFVNSEPDYLYSNLKELCWRDLHILTVDFVLWHLAKQGFTLRANKKFMENDNDK